MKLPNISRKNTAILNTVLAVGLGFLLYFLLHSKNNEKEFIEKCYRDLNRISHNIDKKLDSYQSNAKYIVDLTDEKDSIRKTSIKKTIKTRKVNKNLSVDKFWVDSKVAGNETLTPQISNEKIYFDIQSDSFKIRFSTNTHAFFNPLIRNTVLQEFVLFENDPDGNNFYSTFLPHVSNPYSNILSKPDSLFDGNKNLLEIGGKKYHVFKAIISSVVPDEKLIVMGLITDDTYNQNIRSFDSWFMVLLIILLIIILLSLPVLKIFNLGPVEELHVHDCVFVAISMLMGTSVAVLLIITTFNNRFEQRASIDKNLRNLSHSVKTNFVNELDSIYNQLIDYDTKKWEFTSTQITEDTSDVKYFKLDVFNTESQRCDKIGPYPFFKYVYWMDSLGIQQALVSVFSDSVRHDTLDHRDYFQKIQNKQAWYLPSISKMPENEDSCRFYIESIRSISSGECIAAISKKSSPNNNNPPFDSLKTEVIVMTTQLYSLMDPAMERGFSFCVINRKGDVLFHSNKDFNLQENLLEENAADNHLIESAIKSRTGIEATLRYHDKKQRAYIQPITHLPFQLVTMYEYEIWESSKTQILSISFLLFLVSLVIFLLQAAILYLLNKRFSKINTPVISLRWLKYSSEPESKNKYLKIIIANLFLIVFLITGNIWLFYQNSNLICNLILCWTTPAFSFAFTYNLLVSERNKQRANYFMFFSAVIIIVTIFLLPEVTANAGFAFVTGYFIISGITLALIIKTSLVDQLSRQLNTEEFKQKMYVLFFFTWLLLFAFIPSFIYYKISHDLEQEITARYSLFEFTNDVFKRKQVIGDFYKEMKSDCAHKIKSQKINRGIYEEPSFHENKRPSCDIGNDTSLVKLLKPYLQLASSAKNMFIRHNALDSSWKSKKYNDTVNMERKHLSFTANFEQKLGKLNLFTLNIGSSDENEKKEFRFIWIFYWICLLLFLIALFHLLQLIARKISGFNLITHYTRAKPLEQIEFDKYARSNDLRLMVIGPTGAHKKDTVLEKVRKYEHVFINLHRPEEYVDHDDPNKLASKKQFIILGYFGYNYFDDASNELKLQLLNRLFRTKTNVIILSDISPDQMYDVYDEKIHQLTDKSAEKRHYYTSKQIEWKQLLDNFIQIYQPLLDKHIDHMLETSPQIDNLTYEEQIRIEQNYLHNYYHTIWKNLSLEEKFLLYDYATDELININNKRALHSLAAKGLIHDKKGSMQIIKHSFRNFILSALKPEEESLRMREIRKKGRWNVLRIILLLLVTALFVIIYLSNKEILFDFKAILIAVGSMLSLLIKFSGTFRHARADQY